jgi:flagellar hook-length control protein FliK
MNNVSGLMSGLVGRSSLVGLDAKTPEDDAGSSTEHGSDHFEAMLSGFSRREEGEPAGSTSGTPIGVKVSLSGAQSSEGTAPPRDKTSPANSSPVDSAEPETATSEGTSRTYSTAAAGLSPLTSAVAQTQSALVLPGNQSFVPHAPASLSAGGDTSAQPQQNSRFFVAGSARRSAASDSNQTPPPPPSSNAPQSAPAVVLPNQQPTSTDQRALSAMTSAPNDSDSAPTPEGHAPVRSMRGFGQSASSTSSTSTSSETEHRHRASDDKASTQAPSSAQSVPVAAVASSIAPVPTLNPAATGSDTPPSTGSSSQPGVSTQAVGARTDAEVDVSSPLSPHRERAADGSTESQTNMKVEVVSQATHFAPVARLSPTQQIVAAITPVFAASTFATPATSSGAAETASPSASVSAPPAAPSVSQPAQVSVKTLDLTLEPADLGSVSVKLNLSSDGLAVEVQASQPITADLIERDKKSLSDGLANAGYNVAGVDVSFAPQSGLGAALSDQNGAQNAGGQSSGDASQGNTGSQSQNGDAQDSSSRQYRQQNNNDSFEQARPGARRSGGTLYI